MLIEPKDSSPLLPQPVVTHEEFQALLYGIFPVPDSKPRDLHLNKPLESPFFTSGFMGLL